MNREIPMPWLDFVPEHEVPSRKFWIDLLANANPPVPMVIVDEDKKDG